MLSPCGLPTLLVIGLVLGFIDIEVWVVSHFSGLNFHVTNRCVKLKNGTFIDFLPIEKVDQHQISVRLMYLWSIFEEIKFF